MNYERSSGIILHPTSFAGRYGIGDLGPVAYRWVDFLTSTGCNLWQILPLGPTGYGDSPYQCFSAFAGNPFLISPEVLLEQELLFPEDLKDMPDFPQERVDYGAVIPWKLTLLDRAYRNFERHASAELKAEYEAFQHAQSSWLADFALFMALKEYHGGAAWVTWAPALRDRDPQALASIAENLRSSVQRQTFRQFLFFRQWADVHEHANEQGIRIIGDIPIYVAHDSSDVWGHPELFYLEKTGMPTVVAGVPPDYFSATGQLWGNPIYKWALHKRSGYSWWLERLKAVLAQVDIVRVDHFRGFAGYWEVPGSAKTAEKGRWVNGPGADFFQVVRDALGDLPIIAEDLGVITPEVEELRDRFGLPGMKILQFAFAGGPEDPFLPHNYVHNCVAYTGTHDNDTVRGWYDRVEEEERDFYRRYLERDGSNVSWDLIRSCWASVAVFSLAPMQDFLSLGNEARMNYPSNPSGNWNWRLPEGYLDKRLRDRIIEINYLYRRGKEVTDSP